MKPFKEPFVPRDIAEHDGEDVCPKAYTGTQPRTNSTRPNFKRRLRAQGFASGRFAENLAVHSLFIWMRIEPGGGTRRFHGNNAGRGQMYAYKSAASVLGKSLKRT